jgi:tRNA (guanine37-N1)-methyltransferase
MLVFITDLSHAVHFHFTIARGLSARSRKIPVEAYLYHYDCPLIAVQVASGANPMRIDVLTLFPGMFQGPMTESMMWKAREYNLLDLRLHDIRDYAADKHRTADDTPYGGGGGMIMRADVVVRAVDAVLHDVSPGTPVILMTPQGRVFSHRMAVELAQRERLVILCGHYEGVDERVRELVVTDEISIGDYVLTGGELAAMVVIDGHAPHPRRAGRGSAQHRDSHAEAAGRAHYTRPAVYRGLEVPGPRRATTQLSRDGGASRRSGGRGKTGPICC